MPTILLTKGQHARVDWRDYRDISKHRWRARWDRHTKSFYADRKVVVAGKHSKEAMHRRILGLSPGDGSQVDHRNHDTLDNRRQNLRVVTQAGNQQNRRDQSAHGHGVAKDKRCRSRPFRAWAWVDSRQVHLGMHATAAEARTAREEFLRR